MNKFKLARIAADYAADRREEALSMLQQAKFLKLEPSHVNSFLIYCLAVKKEKETFYQHIKRSLEKFNPYFITISNQKRTSLKVYTFDSFYTFWILKSDLNSKTKRLLIKYGIKVRY